MVVLNELELVVAAAQRLARFKMGCPMNAELLCKAIGGWPKALRAHVMSPRARGDTYSTASAEEDNGTK